MNFAKGTGPSSRPWWKKTDWMKTKKGMAVVAVFLILLGSAAAYFTAPDTAVPSSDNSAATKDDDSKVDEDVSEGENNPDEEDTDDPEVTTPSPSTVKPPSAAPPPPPSSPSPVAIDITTSGFSPSSRAIKQGTTVTWTNRDADIHAVTSDDDGFTSSGSLNQNDTHSYTFNTIGEFSYHCSFHQSMTGTIVVTN